MMTTVNGNAERKVTVDLEHEIGELARAAVQDTAERASIDTDYAYIVAYQINVMIEANMRLRNSHRISGKDFAACLQIADYMTRGKP
jgi:hypothetical protein